MEIRKHGICVDMKKSRVQCNYCKKQMTSFTRLKHHLGGVGPDVTPCEQVTLSIRETFRNMVTKVNSGLTPTKRVGEVQMSNSTKRVRREDSSTKIDSFKNENTSVEEEDTKQELSHKAAQKSIARFFYENYIDISAVDSSSFREMMTLVGGTQTGIKIPDSHDLNGWILQDTLKEVQDHVKKIKDSWEITGCSILLDAWIDEKGRDLVAFVADCPEGPVYLKSLDVSDVKGNTNALTSLVDEVVDEVGVSNVIQIIACSTSGWIGELAKSSESKVFWSVSISHCFELVLSKIGKMYSIENILDKINHMSESLNNNNGIDSTVSSSFSEFEFVTPYLTLESIFKAKEDDITISELVKDSSFWDSVERVVKCTSHLIRGLLLISTINSEHVGYIYDTIDNIKESIAKEFDNEKLCYKPVWDVIDDVWNKHLHSPLHAAGYFLNPTAFYSTDFHLDPEVATGLASSLVHIVKDCHIQVKVAKQLDKYRLGEDCFNEASQADQISRISPTEWWYQKASQYSELQSFAIKILSQTCEGASRYKLKRSLAEKLLFTEGRSRQEQQHLEELAFVHYNLHLQSCNTKLSDEQ